MTHGILAACRDGNREHLEASLANGDPVGCLDDSTTGSSRWLYGGQNQVSDRGLSPMHLAAKMGHRALIDVLLGAGADIEARSALGWTPLIAAATAGRADCVEALLDAGANVAAVTEKGFDALHGAAQEGHPAVVAVLLRRGIPKDSKVFGVGAIHHAAIKALSLRELVNGKKGETSDGATYCVVEGQVCIDDNPMEWEMVSYLHEDTRLDDALRHYLGATECARLLAEAGADITLANGGNTVQHVFAELGEPALLAYVNNWALANQSGSTPSHGLASCRRADGVRKGLECGADLTLRDAAGLAPIHYFADKGGPAAVLRELIAGGADLNDKVTGSTTYPVGTTPLDIAKQWDDLELTKALSAAAR